MEMFMLVAGMLGLFGVACLIALGVWIYQGIKYILGEIFIMGD